MWAFLEHPELFEKVLTYSFPSSQNRYWHKFSYPKNTYPAFSKQDLNGLGKEIGSYFFNRDGRGELCRAEHHSFQDKEYLFAHPSDYPDIIPEWLETGQFDLRSHRFAFLVIFIFSKKSSSLDIYVEEPLEVKRELFAIWAREILKLDNVDTKPKRAFNLNLFYTRNHGLRIPVTSPVKSLTVQRLKFAPRHNPKATYTVDVDTSENAHAVYDELEKKYLNINNIKQVCIRATMQMDGMDKETSCTFDISPSSCSLKHEDEAGVLRQFLKNVGIDETP